MVNMVRKHSWSFDTCVGRARREQRFPAREIPCTKTLYNLLWAGELPIKLFELPEVLSRRSRRKPKISKRISGHSIDERSPEVADRNTFGHWEADTVLGRKRNGEPAVFTIVERLTGCYFSIWIDSKTTDGVASAMEQLKEQYGEKFSQVFRSIKERIQPSVCMQHGRESCGKRQKKERAENRTPLADRTGKKYAPCLY